VEIYLKSLYGFGPSIATLAGITILALLVVCFNYRKLYLAQTMTDEEYLKTFPGGITKWENLKFALRFWSTGISLILLAESLTMFFFLCPLIIVFKEISLNAWIVIFLVSLLYPAIGTLTSRLFEYFFPNKQPSLKYIPKAFKVFSRIFALMLLTSTSILIPAYIGIKLQSVWLSLVAFNVIFLTDCLILFVVLITFRSLLLKFSSSFRKEYTRLAVEEFDDLLKKRLMEYAIEHPEAAEKVNETLAILYSDES